MKNQINEVKRMQQLVNIKENKTFLLEEYISLNESMGVLAMIGLANLLSYAPVVKNRMIDLRNKNIGKAKEKEDQKRIDQGYKEYQQATDELKSDISKSTIDKILKDEEIQKILTAFGKSFKTRVVQDIPPYEVLEYDQKLLQQALDRIKQKYGKEGDQIVNALNTVAKNNGRYDIHAFDQLIGDRNKSKQQQESLDIDAVVNEVRRMQFLAGILKEDYNTLDEPPASLAKTTSELYDEVLDLGYDVDDEHVDGTMEDIIKKVGLTPEQQKKKGFYKFAFGDHPEFETLTDEQLQAIIPFLEAVIERGDYGLGQGWNGTEIVDDDMNFSDDDDMNFSDL